MILPIYIYGQPVLRKQAVDIDKDFEGLPSLLDNMFETLTESDGIGLAAPQIGKDIRVVVIDLDVLSEDLSEYKGFKKAFVASDPDLVKFGVTAKVTDLLEKNGIAFELYSDIKPNPTIENVQHGVVAYQ